MNLQKTRNSLSDTIACVRVMAVGFVSSEALATIDYATMTF